MSHVDVHPDQPEGGARPGTSEGVDPGPPLPWDPTPPAAPPAHYHLEHLGIYVIICERCGAVVAEVDAHDAWHEEDHGTAN